MDGLLSTVSANVTGSYQSVSAQKASDTENTKSKAESKEAEGTAAEAQAKGAASTPAATYEPSGDTPKVTSPNTRRTDADRKAIIDQMNADMEKQKNQLLDIVRKTMTGQGNAIAIGTEDDSLWRALANGDFTIDEAARMQAEKDIAEDGYWGVEKTSDRILDFAKALSGDDPSKADTLLKAFEDGFKEATKSWGKDLPDISKRTYDAVHEKFEAWKNGTDTKEAPEAGAEAAAGAE